MSQAQNGKLGIDELIDRLFEGDFATSARYLELINNALLSHANNRNALEKIDPGQKAEEEILQKRLNKFFVEVDSLKRNL